MTWRPTLLYSTRKDYTKKITIINFNVIMMGSDVIFKNQNNDNFGYKNTFLSNKNHQLSRDK